MTRDSRDSFDDDAPSDEFSDALTNSDHDAEEALDNREDAAAGPIVAALDGVDELKKVLAAELSTDSTQHYINQIGLRPLLTAEQEVHFAMLAKQNNNKTQQKKNKQKKQHEKTKTKHYIN